MPIPFAKNIMKKSEPFTIAVLDDHPFVGKAMQYWLGDDPRMTLTGIFNQRQDLMKWLDENSADLLVLDYLLALDELDGLQMIKQIRGRFPKLKILVVSSVEKPAIVNMMLQAGVRGFIGKSKDPSEFIAAMYKVCCGERFLSDDMQLTLQKFAEADREMHDYLEPREQGTDISLLVHNLTPREMEVLRCYLDGMSIFQISAKYARSRKTISSQKQTALRKLGLRSDMELFKYKDYLQDIITQD